MSEDVVKWISQVGFPIAAYLLLYFDLRKLLYELKALIKEMCLKMEYLGKKKED